MAAAGAAGPRLRHPGSRLLLPRRAPSQRGSLPRHRSHGRVLRAVLLRGGRPLRPVARLGPRPGQQHVRLRLDQGIGHSLSRRRRLHPAHWFPGRSAFDRDAGGGVVCRPDGDGLLDRLHEGRAALHLVLRGPLPVPGIHADPGVGRQLPAALHRLGGRGHLLLPPHRLLLRASLGRRSREEGLHHYPPRRRRAADRHHHALGQS